MLRENAKNNPPPPPPTAVNPFSHDAATSCFSILGTAAKSKGDVSYAANYAAKSAFVAYLSHTFVRSVPRDESSFSDLVSQEIKSDQDNDG